ncbi:hypothetical protein B0H63DRAFT_450794 [Podospora didyma]|uniref:Uncharacterized protein n=1 Tax=Podospora didyma TaxID=330526 RepID=A0AAE0NH98_9PEZI|nr:hypothetical protein B0H63DRAFT_450794 [Podospora didyma]
MHRDPNRTARETSPKTSSRWSGKEPIRWAWGTSGLKPAVPHAKYGNSHEEPSRWKRYSLGQRASIQRRQQDVVLPSSTRSCADCVPTGASVRNAVVESGSTSSPWSKRGSRSSNTWPTLAILGGVDQSLRELHSDMRYWFALSDHTVKIVLLVKFDRARSHVTLESERKIAGGGGPDPTTPVLRQTISITKDTAITSNTGTSSCRGGGALLLPFNLLFLRKPAGPEETDFVFNIGISKYAAELDASPDKALTLYQQRCIDHPTVKPRRRRVGHMIDINVEGYIGEEYT